MRKFISLFIALMIFGFSIFGEAAHASASTCADSGAVVRSNAQGIRCGSVTTVSSAAHLESSVSGAEEPAQAHDCHFGHCAFTLLLPASIGAPISFDGGDFLPRATLAQSDFRSETIRPPASV